MTNCSCKRYFAKRKAIDFQFFFFFRRGKRLPRRLNSKAIPAADESRVRDPVRGRGSRGRSLGESERERGGSWIGREIENESDNARC